MTEELNCYARKNRVIYLNGRDGKATTINLPISTWEAVDNVAASCDMKWTDWARNIFKDAPKGANRTEIIRSALIDHLTARALFDDRAGAVDTWEGHPMMAGGTYADDEWLDDYLKTAKSIDGETDFIGFKVIFGTDRDSRPFIAIKNGLRVGGHFVMAGPL